MWEISEMWIIQGKNWKKNLILEFQLFWSPMTGPLPSLNAFSLLAVVKNTLGNNTANWMAPTMRLASHSQQQSFCMATSFFPVTGELKYQNTLIHFLMGENSTPEYVNSNAIWWNFNLIRPLNFIFCEFRHFLLWYCAIDLGPFKTGYSSNRVQSTFFYMRDDLWDCYWSFISVFFGG